MITRHHEGVMIRHQVRMKATSLPDLFERSRTLTSVDKQGADTGKILNTNSAQLSKHLPTQLRTYDQQCPPQRRSPNIAIENVTLDSGLEEIRIDQTHLLFMTFSGFLNANGNHHRYWFSGGRPPTPPSVHPVPCVRPLGAGGFAPFPPTTPTPARKK